MKKKELNKAREKSVAELTKKVNELKKEQAATIGEQKAGKETNLKKAGNIGREIAQTLTIIGEKKRENKKTKTK